MKDLKNHYAVGQRVLYRDNKKAGTVIKVTKTSIVIKYIGYKVTYSKVKFPEFLTDLVIQP